MITVSMMSAVRSSGTMMVLSWFPTLSPGEVARAVPDVIKYFNIYITVDRNWTLYQMQQAQSAGFKGFVLTVDEAGVGGIRYHNQKNNVGRIFIDRGVKHPALDP